MMRKQYLLLLALIFFSMSYVSAFTNQTTPFPIDIGSNTANANVTIGWRLSPLTDIIVYSVYRNQTTGVSNPDIVYIRNATNGIIASSTFSGLKANFSGVTLLAGGNYSIVMTNRSGVWTTPRTGLSSTFPFAFTDINITAMFQNDGLEYTGSQNWWVIGRLEYENFQNNITLNSPTNGSFIFSSSALFNATVVSGLNKNITNATLYIWDSSGIFNTTTQVLSGPVNTSLFNVTTLLPDTYYWNVLGCSANATASLCQFAPQNYTFVYGYIENSQTFNPTVLGGTVQTFSINITIASAFHATLVRLIYNNTAYLPDSILNDGNNYVYSRNVTVPSVISPTTKNFYWEITLSNGAVNTFNSTNRTQTLTRFQSDTCSAQTQNILNFTLYDEDTLLPLNGTIQLEVTFYTAGTDTVLGIFNNSYAFTTSSGPARVCINQTNTSLEMDWHALYFSNVSLYPVEHKFAQRVLVTNTTQSINLYNILDSRQTPFQIILQSASLDSISGALIDIQREYVYLGQFISVETPLTNVYGTTIGHFVAEEPYYTFVISKDGEILGTFERQQVKCQNVVTGDCRITLNLIDSSSDPPDFQTFGNISVTYNWSQSTRTLRTLWISADGSSHTVLQNITLFDNWGNNTVCSTTGTGITGTYVCTVPQGYGNQSIISYLYSDGRFIGFATFNLGDSANDIFGGTKVVLGMLMYTTLTLLMIANPVSLMIGSILGMAFIVAFHIADGGSFIGNSSIFLWFVIAAGIVIYHISKRNS